MKHQQTAGSGTHEPGAKKTPAKSSTRTRGAGQPKAAADSTGRDEMIRQTAYRFYLARGCVAGYELDDWLQAEEQVNQAIAGSQASASSAALPQPA